jgi:hypothetical protein
MMLTSQEVIYPGQDFSYVDLTNSKLTPTNFQEFDPTNSNWWDAAEVDQDLLKLLITYRYPGYVDRESIATSTPLTKDYYVHRIEILGKPFITNCKREKLLFEDRFDIRKPQATR